MLELFDKCLDYYISPPIFLHGVKYFLLPHTHTHTNTHTSFFYPLNLVPYTSIMLFSFGLTNINEEKVSSLTTDPLRTVCNHVFSSRCFHTAWYPVVSNTRCDTPDPPYGRQQIPNEARYTRFSRFLRKRSYSNSLKDARASFSSHVFVLYWFVLVEMPPPWGKGNDRTLRCREKKNRMEERWQGEKVHRMTRQGVLYAYWGSVIIFVRS